MARIRILIAIAAFAAAGAARCKAAEPDRKDAVVPAQAAPYAAADTAAGRNPAKPAKKTGAVPAQAAPYAKQYAAGKDEGRGGQAVKTSSAGSEQAEEEGSVMIDGRTEGDSSGRFSEDESMAYSGASGGIPASYGQLKGTLNDGGRNFLVFESEDGVISFVQILTGRNSMDWKLAGKVPRSAAE
jgi:hypothetical protein